MFHIGIIGCGKIAQVRHIPEYKALNDVKIAGFYDVSRERAEALANVHGGMAYASYEEMLENPQIDAVSVCAANHVHAEITIKALEAGKHVLCEKPMAMTLEECKEMVEASERTGKILMIGHNQRLAKAHGKAKELIETGAIGKLITFQAMFVHKGPETWSIDAGKSTWFFDKSKAVLGAMADLGIHKTDLIQYLTGEKVTEATAVLTTLEKTDASGNKIGVDDNAFCIYKMQSGIVGTMTAGWTCYGNENNSTVIYGTKGVMKIYSDPDYSIILEMKDGETVKYSIDKIQTNDNQTTSGVIDMFADALRTGKEPELNGRTALNAMEAVFACVESSRTGRTVQIKR